MPDVQPQPELITFADSNVDPDTESFAEPDADRLGFQWTFDQ